MLVSEAIKQLEDILARYGDGELLADKREWPNYMDVVEFVPNAFSFLREKENCVLAILEEFDGY
jgi:hypothetical protein